MKKILLSLLVLISLTLVGCNPSNNGDNDKKEEEQKQEYKVIMPSGTPSISLSSFVDKKEDNITVDIVLGSDPLTAAFTSGNYDIIVAPVNLGAKFYNSVEDFAYRLYRPIVGGNYYILSTEVSSFQELTGKDITLFGQNSTPDVMFRTLCAYYGVEPNVTYQASVAEANSQLAAGAATTILTAEPSKTLISKNKSYNVIDLQELWKEMAGSEYNVTQAGIFVKTGLDKEDVEEILAQMEASLTLALEDTLNLAKVAKKIDTSFTKFSDEDLAAAISNCNVLGGGSNYRADVEYYFNKLIQLGLGKSIGGKLPDENFYDYK